MMVFVVTSDNSVYLVRAYALTKSPSATSDRLGMLYEIALYEKGSDYET
jgi:hypothetical protein